MHSTTNGGGTQRERASGTAGRTPEGGNVTGFMPPPIGINRWVRCESLFHGGEAGGRTTAHRRGAGRPRATRAALDEPFMEGAQGW